VKEEIEGTEKTEEEIAELLMEAKYSDICADLMTSCGHKWFLRRLGTQKSGTWVEVDSLTDGSSESSPRLKTLEVQQNCRLHVMWAKHPEVGVDYCVITFFLCSTLWSYGAITRKANLRL